jgi:hypothetical protein
MQKFNEIKQRKLLSKISEFEVMIGAHVGMEKVKSAKKKQYINNSNNNSSGISNPMVMTVGGATGKTQKSRRVSSNSRKSGGTTLSGEKVKVDLSEIIDRLARVSSQ